MRLAELATKTRKSISSQEASINAQLLERAGYVSKLMAGVYSFLPLGLRVLQNIEKIVRQEMNELGAQEVLMPALQPKELWEVTGRWNTVDVLYKLISHDREFCLGPTHEEVVTPLLGQYITSYKDLPKAVYQIQTKFRDEARPKSGLLRGREFRMKDLYSFHASEQELDEYYLKVKESYLRIFKRLGLGHITYFTYASGGIFSKYSHEFQTITPYGEDTIYTCQGCQLGINKEIIQEQANCPLCQNPGLIEQRAIEVGNIFKLNYRFTEPFDVLYTDEHDQKKPVSMGCYGMGTSRLMGAIVEALHDERGIIWPAQIAPYAVHIVLLSKSDQGLSSLNKLLDLLNNAGIEYLLDDRPTSAGEKFADADLLGMPIRLVVSDKTAAAESVEFKKRNESESQLIVLNSVVAQIVSVING